MNPPPIKRLTLAQRREKREVPQRRRDVPSNSDDDNNDAVDNDRARLRQRRDVLFNSDDAAREAAALAAAARAVAARHAAIRVPHEGLPLNNAAMFQRIADGASLDPALLQHYVTAYNQKFMSQLDASKPFNNDVIYDLMCCINDDDEQYLITFVNQVRQFNATSSRDVSPVLNDDILIVLSLYLFYVIWKGTRINSSGFYQMITEDRRGGLTAKQFGKLALDYGSRVRRPSPPV
jgi:hypothetical protein